MCKITISLSKIDNLLKIIKDPNERELIEDLELFEIYLLYLKETRRLCNVDLKLPLNTLMDKLSSNDVNIDMIFKIINLILHHKEEYVKIIEEYVHGRCHDQIIEMRFLEIVLNYKAIDLVKFYRKIFYNRQDKMVQNYFVTCLIPKYLEKYGEDVLIQIWEQSESLAEITYLFPYYLKCKTIDLIKGKRFWNFLQNDLRNSKKFANLFLHESIEILKKREEFCCEGEIIKFTCDIKEDYFKSLRYLILLFNASGEKQLHLIQPSLPMLEKISILHDSWLELIFCVYLKHPHNTVVYQTIHHLFNSSWDFQNIYPEVLNGLNKSEFSRNSKSVFKKFSEQINSLNYKKLLNDGMKINFTPINFWAFYTQILQPEVEYSTLKRLIKEAMQLPDKYIRKGCIMHIYELIEIKIKITKTLSKDLIDILLEFTTPEDGFENFTHKILENVQINECLDLIWDWLNEEYPNESKINLSIEIINRSNITSNFLTKIQQAFLKRQFNLLVLDRLTYLYFIKTSDLHIYINDRLDFTEKSNSICHIDKLPQTIIRKCVKILKTDSYSVNQQVLAFEILFYLNENRFKDVYQHWIIKLLSMETPVHPELALGFVKFLLKLSRNVLNFNEVLKVYEKFLITQPNNVIERIFQNMDYILTRIEEIDFIKLVFSHLNETRKMQCFENLVKNFIRNVAVCIDDINSEVLSFIMIGISELVQISDHVIYYSALYFKFLKIPKEFTLYKYLLHGEILNKEERAEYEVCKSIHIKFHEPNPYFRTSEIHKWILQDILFNITEERIIEITKFLISEYKTYFNKRYFPDSSIHLQKLRIMQTIAFITPYLMGSIRDEILELLTESFCIESHQTSVRQLMQYIFIQLLKNDKNALNYIYNQIKNASKTHPSTIAGFIPILYGLHLIRNDVVFSMNLVEILLPWTMGANFKLRLYSQLVIKKIARLYEEDERFILNYKCLYYVLDEVLKLTTQIDSNILKDLNLIERINIEKPHADNKKLIYLISVYIPEKNDVTPTEWEYFKIKNAWNKYAAENLCVNEISDFKNELVENVQKKIIPWRDLLLEKKNRGELILVTSLIESTANLGGLSRTCEVLGVKFMAVNTLKVVQDKEFQSLSMSSERWLDLIEVKIADLQEFILGYKKNNYKIIGAEQTNESVDLRKHKFEEKTVILLGNERSGIPPELIPLLDLCVEIPQCGMIRSLNVHVAGAMFIWEYTKQCFIK